jgi:hypothetical protein
MMNPAADTAQLRGFGLSFAWVNRERIAASVFDTALWHAVWIIAPFAGL